MKDSTEGWREKRAGRESASAKEPAPPAYHVGDEIVFKFEGNLRARVTGFEEVGGRTWLEARARLRFLVPPSLVVGVEREGGER
jgi:hypothetical protein